MRFMYCDYVIVAILYVRFLNLLSVDLSSF